MFVSHSSLELHDRWLVGDKACQDATAHSFVVHFIMSCWWEMRHVRVPLSLLLHNGQLVGDEAC